MKLKETPVLELLVRLDPKDIVSLETEIGSVVMIPFQGTAEGENFRGIIEPCGVDTQVTDACGVKKLSARYMLTGKDAAGQDCRIYVANDAWFLPGAEPRPWHSTPKFLTDSRLLAPRLHRDGIVGEGLGGPEGLRIRFFEPEE